MNSSRLFVFAFFCVAALNAETRIVPEISPRGGWQKTAENTFSIQRTAEMQGTASLELKAPLKPGTFYPGMGGQGNRFRERRTGAGSAGAGPDGVSRIRG